MGGKEERERNRQGHRETQRHRKTHRERNREDRGRQRKRDRGRERAPLNVKLLAIFSWERESPFSLRVWPLISQPHFSKRPHIHKNLGSTN